MRFFRIRIEGEVYLIAFDHIVAVEPSTRGATLRTTSYAYSLPNVDARTLAAKIEIESGDRARTCAKCGCTDADPCIDDGGPCHWIGLELCSSPSCAPTAPRDPNPTEPVSEHFVGGG